MLLTGMSACLSSHSNNKKKEKVSIDTGNSLVTDPRKKIFFLMSAVSNKPYR